MKDPYDKFHQYENCPTCNGEDRPMTEGEAEIARDLDKLFEDDNSLT